MRTNINMLKVLRFSSLLFVFSFFFLCDITYSSAIEEVDIGTATSHNSVLSCYEKDENGVYALNTRFFTDGEAVGRLYYNNGMVNALVDFNESSNIYLVYYEKNAPVRAYLYTDSLQNGTYTCGGKSYRYRYYSSLRPVASQTEGRAMFRFNVPYVHGSNVIDGHDVVVHKLFSLSDVSGSPDFEYPPGAGDGEYDKKMGYPLKFFYRLKKIDIGLVERYNMNHIVTWKNPTDGSVDDCTLQLQFKGTYKVRKNIFSKVETVNIDYFDIDELDIYALQYKISSWKFDFWEGSNPTPGLVYEKIVDKVGYGRYLLTDKPKTTFRARYVRRNSTGNFSYGPWVQCTVDGDSITIPIVTDEEEKPIDTPDYPGVPGDPSDPNDPSYDNEDKNILEALLAPIRDFFDSVNRLFDALKTSINALISNIGQVPALFMKILSFLPQEIWGLISVGIGIVIILRVLGR